MSIIDDKKNCFITGATGGLGREIAKKLNKYNLFLTDMNIDKLNELKEELQFEKKNDSNIYVEAGNLESLKDIEKIIKSAKCLLPSVDILINCAGVFPAKSLFESSVEDFNYSFSINVRAPFIFSKEFSKDMKKNRWGRIVNIGSSSAYNGFKNTSLYCSSKHALLGFSRSLYDELKEFGIRTFCISPGSIKTEMGKSVKNQDFNTFINPEEIAKYLMFIISFDKEMISEEVRLNRVEIR